MQEQENIKEQHLTSNPDRTWTENVLEWKFSLHTDHFEIASYFYKSEVIYR